MTDSKWQFWVDRGGTFTDIIARTPTDELTTFKLLSVNPDLYEDASVHGIRTIMGIPASEELPLNKISSIKMGTTIGTNALLERKGEKTALIITKGFKDALEIGNQSRPDLFALHIKKPSPLYECVEEIDERINYDGEIIKPINREAAKKTLLKLREDGYRSIAVAFMHTYSFPEHEKQLKSIADELGFDQVSVSHEVSPLIKLINRGDTTVADAYLTPALDQYKEDFKRSLNKKDRDPEILFMQSNGGMTDLTSFRGKDSILSGPAGGIIGAVETADKTGFSKIIAFDMGGTSTDVSHYNGELEYSYENNIAGTRIATPSLKIHTVAAGGGSILHYQDNRFTVGPDSAGASPGPASYGKDGPLTVTDANVLLGRVQADYMPNTFGENGSDKLNTEIVRDKFSELTETINKANDTNKDIYQVAEGFRKIAIENMSQAIKTISIQRGYDLKDYCLCSFGGAGGQHACHIAETLGIKKILIHKYAGVLSAYGIGMAARRTIHQQSVEKIFTDELMPDLEALKSKLESKCVEDLKEQNIEFSNISTQSHIHLKYEGTNNSFKFPFSDRDSLIRDFTAEHRKYFNFTNDNKELTVEMITVEGVEIVQKAEIRNPNTSYISDPIDSKTIYCDGKQISVPVYDRNKTEVGQVITGPAIVSEDTATTIVEPGWSAVLQDENALVLTHDKVIKHEPDKHENKNADPATLEIFNRRFMAVAENMGYALQNTAQSVNIRERLDFSCAIFSSDGSLIANAPHIPVHLGSMSDAVKSWINSDEFDICPGDSFVLNSPYHGGTHLPDITVVSPLFSSDNKNLLFFVASRGHHMDVGGTTPGSMPPDSCDINEEGIVISGFKLCEDGIFKDDKIRALLKAGNYPCRNPDVTIADLKAQVAANTRGLNDLRSMIDFYSENKVINYSVFVKQNAEEIVRTLFKSLKGGSFKHSMDIESHISVSIDVDINAGTATIDFTGTSNEGKHNFNAPAAISKAVILYAIRSILDHDIPLNDGCLKPIKIIIPERSILNPSHPSAVVAGNVETSQHIADAIFGALGTLACSQGTMNNLTFGNVDCQYYETIAGGSGAGDGFDGAHAVQCHMTNTRMTDPEVLELNYPVILEEFSIRENSGGAGKFRGGNGVIRKIRACDKLTASILSSHRINAPFGSNNGASGKPGKNYVIRNDGSIRKLKGRDKVTLSPGDIIAIETPGGGGYSAKE